MIERNGGSVPGNPLLSTLEVLSDTTSMISPIIGDGEIDSGQTSSLDIEVDAGYFELRDREVPQIVLEEGRGDAEDWDTWQTVSPQPDGQRSYIGYSIFDVGSDSPLLHDAPPVVDTGRWVPPPEKLAPYQEELILRGVIDRLHVAARDRLAAIKGSPSFKERALCHGIEDRELLKLFFPSESTSKRKKEDLLKICAECDVLVTCFELSMRRREHGIWGGTLEVERQRIRKGEVPERLMDFRPAVEWARRARAKQQG